MKVKIDLNQFESEMLHFSDLPSLITSLNGVCEKHGIKKAVKDKVLLKIISHLSVPQEAEGRVKPKMERTGSSQSVLKVEKQKVIEAQGRRSSELRQNLASSAPKSAAKPQGRVGQLRPNVWTLKRGSDTASPLITLQSSPVSQNVSEFKSATAKPSHFPESIEAQELFKRSSLRRPQKPLPKFSASEVESLPQSQFQSFNSTAPQAKPFNLYKNFRALPQKENLSNSGVPARIDKIFAKLDQKRSGKLNIDNFDICALSSEDLQFIQKFVLKVYASGKDSSYDKRDLLMCVSEEVF